MLKKLKPRNSFILILPRPFHVYICRFAHIWFLMKGWHYCSYINVILIITMFIACHFSNSAIWCTLNILWAIIQEVLEIRFNIFCGCLSHHLTDSSKPMPNIRYGFCIENVLCGWTSGLSLNLLWSFECGLLSWNQNALRHAFPRDLCMHTFVTNINNYTPSITTPELRDSNWPRLL